MPRKKGPGLNLSSSSRTDPPPSVPNLPPDLDRTTTITVGQVVFEIEADDLEVICELGTDHLESEDDFVFVFVFVSFRPRGLRSCGQDEAQED